LLGIIATECTAYSYNIWYTSIFRPPVTPPVKQSLNQLKATNVEKTLTSAVNVPQQPQLVAPVSVQPLTNIHVPLNSVKPGGCKWKPS